MTSPSHDLAGKVYMVTGANTGIGRVTAVELCRRGGHVVLACRSAERTQPVIEEILAGPEHGEVEFLPLELGSLASVRDCAAAFLAKSLPLHGLINNAGLAGHQGATSDGFELTFGVNHLGHFLLTELLLDKLKESAPARIVNVSSRAHYKAKGVDFAALTQPQEHLVGMGAYEVSKLCNVLHAKELARRLEGSQVTTYSQHPGVVASDVWRRIPWPFRGLIKLFMISNEQGAETSLHCAASPEAGAQTGLFYDKSQPKAPNPLSDSEELAAELWTKSEEWTAAWRG
jgi:retinol dehydrogenase-12